MSGIVGIVHLGGAPIDHALLKRMVDRMSFRGPDAQNTWVDGQVGLGRALLRTTDESEQEQGPCSLDGQVWITADARIDGRLDLAHKLRLQGSELAVVPSDSELILHAYRVWGEGCLEHLAGDFAFAIWDQHRCRLFCARDQLGVVPFFFAQVNSTLVFGNTLQAVQLYPGVSDDLNEAAIGDYLLFRSCHDLSASVFAGVQRLPPAHTLTWSLSDGAPRARRYWALPEGLDYVHYKNPNEYIERFADLFRQAVADRLRTDHAAVAMSGGMDSPAVAAVAHEVLSARGELFDLCAFTHSHTLIASEEVRYAEMVAEAIGFSLQSWDNDARILNPPHGQYSEVSPEPTLIVSGWLNPWGEMWRRTAANGCVILTGHGGDPALRLLPTYWFDLLKRKKYGRIAAEMWQYVRRYRRRPPLGFRTAVRQRSGRAPSRRSLPIWLDPDFAARQNLQARLEEQAELVGGHDGLVSMATNPFWSNLLTSWDPGNTLMPFRARFPFFDLRLIIYLLQVPPIPWFENKTLLREAMQDLLPESVLQRRKTTLPGNPLEALTRERGVPAYLEDLVTLPELTPYVDRDVLLRVIRSPKQTTDSAYRSIIRPVTLAYWLRYRHGAGSSMQDQEGR